MTSALPENHLGFSGPFTLAILRLLLRRCRLASLGVPLAHPAGAKGYPQHPGEGGAVAHLHFSAFEAQSCQKAACSTSRATANRAWPGVMRWLFVIWIVLTGTSPTMAMQPQCSDIRANLIPSLTTLTATPSAGTVWSGVLRVNATNCVGLTLDSEIQILTTPAPTAPAATTVSGLSVQSNGTPTLSILSGGCVNVTTFVSANGEFVYWYQPGARGVPCNVQADFPIKFTKIAGVVSGTLGPNQLVASSSTSTGWVATQLTGMPGPWDWVTSSLSQAPTLAMSTQACTVAPNVIPVFLPTVSKTALNAAGATAGLTAFTLALSGCPNGSNAYAVQATWSFNPGPSSSVVANSAASPANNVYVQLLDSTLSPITNGASTTLANVTAGGSFSATYYARYYATAAAGSGAVKGTATFTLTYQ
jgi:major type 1 subunit fimbrin (pilin)